VTIPDPSTKRASVLGWSRAVGWCLAVLVLVLSLALVVQARNTVEHQAERGTVNAQSFIGKVRTCYRHGKDPHRTWQSCERRVLEISDR
jgi:hypothetical protein